MNKKIKVVAAVIKNKDKFLIMKRGGTGMLRDKWEFPGGKIEEGETIQQTIVREIKEELDVKILANEVIGVTEYKYPFAVIQLTFVECALLDDPDNIKLNVHQDLQWIKSNEFNNINWAPADVEILKKISFL